MAQSYQAEIQRDPTGLYNQPIDLSGEFVKVKEVRANPEKYNVQVKSVGGTLNYFNYLK